MGRYRYALPPSLQKQTTTIIPIIELTKYQLRESTGNLQKIEKHYQMIAVKQEGQEPLQQLTGRGEIIFDCEAGCIKECNMELEVSRRQGNVVETMPLKYSYQLGDVYTREQWNTKLAEASVQAKKQMSDYEQRQIEREREEKVKGRKLIEDSIAGLDKLRGTNLYLKLSEISRVKPIPEYRDQISKLVDPYLLSKESSVRSSALDVIKTWGTSHNKTNLLKLLDSLDNLTRENACECLANCVKEPDVAEKIASLFDSDDASDHYAAKDALKEMGAVAEDVVLKLLDREDEEMRSTAIDLLCEMGTNKCIPFLQKIIDSRANRSLSSSAQTALSAIDRRLAKGAK
jgi:hypothetical protein